jgi:ankyrin repeat protein/L-ascorbate metabolism protein UlaG (beta-lactamase superfamily)
MLLPTLSGGMDQSSESNQVGKTNFAAIPDDTIVHLGHSSVLLKIDHKVLIFDHPYGSRSYADKIRLLEPEEIRHETVYVFSSHGHGDHHNAKIFTWRGKIPHLKFILSSDIAIFPAGSDVIRMAPGKQVQVDDMKIRSYLSADAGVAYSIYIAGKHIYFSGDNGYWRQQKDQTEEDYVLQYLSAIDRSVPIDVAFQVCDQFLFEQGRGYGGTEIFAVTFQPKLLVPLHLRGRYDYLKDREQQLEERGFRNQFWVVKNQGDSISCANLSSANLEPKSAESLNQAAATGDLARVKKLIVAGANVNDKNNDSRTPLHLAAGLGSREVVELLLSRGADVKAQDKYEWTPLHVAIRANRIDIVELLLQKGADLESKDQSGLSPLNTAAAVGDLSMVNLLLDAGAQINTGNKFKRSPLYVAAGTGDIALVKLLLANGANVQFENNRGATPLHKAVDDRQIEIVKLLIQAGANVNAKTRTDRFPIHAAVLNGRLDMIQLLIDHGAQVNIKDSMGYSPLRIARNGKDEEVIQLLLKHGAKD